MISSPLSATRIGEGRPASTQGYCSRWLQYCRPRAPRDNLAIMNWDDLRIVAAIRDEGTFAAASARLRIDETTVGRRLRRIEKMLGVRLFEAADGVRKPTEQCERVLAHVTAMAGHVAEIGRVGQSLPGLTGRFRIAATNAIAEEVLSPRVAG